jgi:DNA repair protein RecO (recombination protein O)
MSASTKDTAVCIRTVDYSDTSQIVTLFTSQSGKISAIAKGSKRKKSSFGGPVELFSYGQILFIPSATGQLATLAEFHQQPVFMPLRRNLYAINCAMFAAELIGSFTEEHDPHPVLFDAFVDFIRDVQDAGADDKALALLILFQLMLLSDIGTKLVLEMCANCSAPFSEKWFKTYFSSSANGLICGDCEQAFTDKLNLSPQVARVLSDLKQIQNAEMNTLKLIEKTFVYHFTELLHRPPRMAKYFI